MEDEAEAGRPDPAEPAQPATSRGRHDLVAAAVSLLRSRQRGVVGRRQLAAVGVTPYDLERLVRRRELTRVHPGVFVDHTGTPTLAQRRWAAVVACWPAALSHASALRTTTSEARVHVAVDRSRHLVAPTGVVVHRLQDLQERVQWQRSPPRLRTEDAVLLVAAHSRDDLRAIAVLADACGSGMTRPGRLRDRARELGSLPRRRWLLAVLEDVAEGTNSVLEHGYLTRVERPHGLPPGHRQDAVVDGSRRFRDVRYPEQEAVVELDGHLFHGAAEQRAADQQRDLVSAARRAEETLRVGYQQVFGTPCVTAELVAQVLERRGWAGHPRRCPACG